MDYAAGLWIYGTLGLVVLSIVVGIVQKYRGKDDLLDMPASLGAPIMWLSLVVAVAGIVVVIANFIR